MLFPATLIALSVAAHPPHCDIPALLGQWGDCPRGPGLCPRSDPCCNAIDCSFDANDDCRVDAVDLLACLFRSAA